MVFTRRKALTVKAVISLLGQNVTRVQSGALEGSDANAVEIMVNLLDFIGLLRRK